MPGHGNKGRKMKAAITKEMGVRVSGAFVLAISLLFSIYIQNADAQTPADYINLGEQQLFTKSITDALDAHTTFIEAKMEYPDDPVINAYLAFTRVLYYSIVSELSPVREMPY